MQFLSRVCQPCSGRLPRGQPVSVRWRRTVEHGVLRDDRPRAVDVPPEHHGINAMPVLAQDLADVSVHRKRSVARFPFLCGDPGNGDGLGLAALAGVVRLLPSPVSFGGRSRRRRVGRHVIGAGTGIVGCGELRGWSNDIRRSGAPADRPPGVRGRSNRCGPAGPGSE